MNWKKNLPLVVFCLYLVKSAILPATFVEAAILLVLGTMACYFEYKSNDAKLSELEGNVKQVQTNLDIKSKELESLKSAVASMKLATGMRTLQNTQPR
jgi:peptidoglycan hydrolase CwlO-like protein